MGMTKTRTLAAATLTILLFGCEEEPPLLEVHALPQALSEVDISYIPFEYADTGHTYHTPLLAMELAAHGIPNVQVMIEQCDNDWTLKAPNGDKWGYHAAVGVSHDGEFAIVDPVLSSDFLSIAEFQAAFSDPNSRVVLGTGTSDGGPSQCKNAANPVVPERVEDMEPFDFRNVMIYCSYMKRSTARSAATTRSVSRSSKSGCTS